MPTSKDRPRDWNSDAIWLWERLLGLVPGQGAGTPSDSLPRGIPTSDVLHYIRGNHESVDSTEETTLQMPITTRAWLLVGMSYHRTTGSGTTITQRVGQVAGFTTDGPDDRLALTTQAVGTLVNVAFCSPIPMHADSASKLYFRPGFDAGSDNNGVYQFWFKQGIETVESS